MPFFSPPRLWALEFANPGLLAGLAAASIPIILHLLNRRKFRETRWAAMRFLLAAIRKNQRRIRIEQWLLLAVRTLLILLIVTAMAKPFLEAFGNVIAGRRTHRVLVLDSSLSMNYVMGGTSRFDQAKLLAAQLVKDSRQGDTISVILMGDPPRVAIGDPLPNLAEVQKEIAELTPTHGAVDLQASFQAVDRVLDVSTIPQKEILFLTDLQQASWRPTGAKDGLDRVLAKIEARRPRSIVIDLAATAHSENRAVTALEVDSPVVTLSSMAPIRAVLRNHGSSTAAGVAVRLTVDGRVGPEQTVDLPVGEDVSVVFNHQFTTPGEHVVEVGMDNDALSVDDSRRLVVPVKESLNVLLVDGHYKSEPFQAETDYLAQALSPSEASPGQPGMFHTEVVPESRLSQSVLDTKHYDSVVLCNVAQFSQTEVTALEDFLRQGGGLVLFGGDQVVADNYNRLLFADGKGLLPASLGASVGDAAKKQSGFGFNPLGYRHALVSEFRGEPDPVTAGLTRALTWQYHKLTIPEGSSAKVALAFENGDPAVVEAPRGRGRVFLVATSADAGWTSWPLHNSYPPVMHQLVLNAASGRLAEHNIRVGQPYDQSFLISLADAAASVVTPRGQSIATKLRAAGGTSQLHFEQTDLAGTYRIHIEAPPDQESNFAANPDPAESDLAKLDQTSLEAQMLGWNFTYLTNWRELTQSAISVGRRGELHRPLLFGALGLLLLESFLAWKFGHHDSLT